jgi:predicted alpha/beta-hydrolase family hydrolase
VARSLTLGGHPALLDKPKDAVALLVLAHGAGAGMRHHFMGDFAAALVKQKIAVLRWEFPYMAAGKARPDPAKVAETAVREVWNAAAKFELPRFAGGKSFGGRMTSRAHAAEPLADLCGIVFVGFPLHPPKEPAQASVRAGHLAAAHGPLLFLQGTRDDLAELSLLRPIVKRLGKRAKLHVIDGADHGFEVLVRSGRTNADVIDELARTTRAWIDATLDT